MRFSPILSEFVRDPRVCMEELHFNAAYSLVMQNMRMGVDMQFEPKTMVSLLTTHGEAYDCTSMDDMEASLSQMGQASADGAQPKAEGAGNTSDDGSFVNVVCIEGPMTRSGDACSYGSKDHKKMMMRAALDSRCRGHILLINSGGGAVGTIADYREAINFCLSRGQNVAAVVDECAASSACFTANMTNRIYAMRDKDEVGSLGMFAAFSTIADGTIIPDTQEVLHIRYADQSVDKNKAFREATDGNMDMIDQMLHDDLSQILADTKQDRPSLLDDQLTGKMYPAREVMGSMVDEIGGVAEAAEWLVNDFNERKGAALPSKMESENAKDNANDNVDDNVDDNANDNVDDNANDNVDANDNEGECNPKKKKCEDDQEDDDPEDKEPEDNPDDHDCPGPKCPEHEECKPKKNCDEDTGIINQTQNTNMYEQIANALELESIESTEEGVMLNASLAEQMEAHLQNHADALAAKEQEMADAIAQKEQEIASLNAALEQKVNELNEAHQQAMTEAENAHNAVVEQLNADHQQDIDALNATIAANAEEMTKANEQIESAKQRINDLTAEVENLNNAQQQQPQAGAQPASNGQQSQQNMKISSARFAYDPSLSAKENAERRKQAMSK